MGRGRAPIPVTPEFLQKVISDLEFTNNFTSRSALWAAVAASDYAKSIGLSAQTAMSRAKEWSLKINTPIGEKGRKPGQGMPANAGVRTRKTIPLQLVEELKEYYPESLHKTIDRAARGNMKAVVKLKCIDCVGICDEKGHIFRNEIAVCDITDCPLWAFRPYKQERGS